MGKLEKITLAFGGISFLLASVHKAFIKDTLIYSNDTFIIIIFSSCFLFMVLIIVNLVYGIFYNLSKKEFKKLGVSILVSISFIGLYYLIMFIDKELFLYAT